MSAGRKQKPKQKGSGGRLGKKLWNPDYVRMALPLGEACLTDLQVSKILDVSTWTLNDWKKKYPKFASALKQGKEMSDEMVEKSLYQRAVGYSHPDVDIRTVAIGGGVSQIVKTDIVKHYPPDPTSCIFWLKNRQPENWRDRQEVVGADGGPVMVVLQAKFNPEEVTGGAPVKKTTI